MVELREQARFIDEAAKTDGERFGVVLGSNGDSDAINPAGE